LTFRYEGIKLDIKTPFEIGKEDGQTMAYEHIIVERKEDGIVKIILNRPQVLNAYSNALLRELKQALTAIQLDDSVAVIILTGTGRAFCAGRDLKVPEDIVGSDEILFDVFPMLQKIGLPVIAAVNGFAIAGGFELAMACDIIIASQNALFKEAHAQMGVLPSAGSSQKLPRLIGEKRAKEILFTSKFISAAEAERMGIVNKVVEPQNLEEEVMLIARVIASQPRQIIRKLKQLVNEGMKMNFDAALIFEELESRKWRANLNREEIAQRAQIVIKAGRAGIEKMKP
jgi:enoyl-CoA hydratase/carnithine racemase